MMKSFCLLVVASIYSLGHLHATEMPFFEIVLNNYNGWYDAGFREQGGQSGTLYNEVVEGDDVLAVQVEASAIALLPIKPGTTAWGFPVASNKVYRIRFEGRPDGQIEDLGLDFYRGVANFTWHGSHEFDVKPGWNSYSVQIKPQFSDDRTIIRFRFGGVGKFWIRSVKVTTMDDFELFVENGASRGELLPNPNFRLADADWFYSVPSYGDHEANFFAESHDRQRFFPTTNGYEFRTPAGFSAFWIMSRRSLCVTEAPIT